MYFTTLQSLQDHNKRDEPDAMCQFAPFYSSKCFKGCGGSIFGGLAIDFIRIITDQDSDVAPDLEATLDEARDVTKRLFAEIGFPARFTIRVLVTLGKPGSDATVLMRQALYSLKARCPRDEATLDENFSKACEDIYNCLEDESSRWTFFRSREVTISLSHCVGRAQETI